MQYTSASEAPDILHFWTGISTIAGALRRNVWIDQVGFQWTPNFYIFLVGPAGVVTKSTTLNYGMGLLEEVPDIFFGPPTATWQGLLPALKDAIQTVKWTDAKGDEHHTPVSALTIPVSELGTFLKAKDDEFMSFLIGLWDGQLSKRGYSKRTQDRGEVRVENPWINIIGCTTPTWLQANMPTSMIGGGFLSRVIFVYANKKRRLVAYPSREWNRVALIDTKTKLVEDLREIATIRGEYQMPDDVLDWGEAWYKDLWLNKKATMSSVRFEPYRARKQTTLHKLAMVIAAAQSNDLIIKKEHLEEADELLTGVEASMLTVFNAIGGVDDARYINEVTELVRGFMPSHNDLVPIKLIWSHLVNVMSLEDFKRAVKSGVEAGLFQTRYTGLFDAAGNSILGITYIGPKT